MAQNGEKILILKENWDFTIHPYTSQPDSRSCFAGRKKELDFLTNEIIRNKNGSILVCGHRGVGKTSLVYKAIQELQRAIKYSETEYDDAIIVIVNCSQLEIKNKSDFKSKRLLKSLIKRLHYTVQGMDHIQLEPEIKKEIEELYEKATASKFKLQKSNNQMNNKSKLKENETSIHIDKVDLLYISLCFLALFSVIFSNIFPSIFMMKIISLISLLFVIPISAITLSHKKNYLYKEKESSSDETNRESEYDNSVGNLEYDLECLYKKIADNDIKILYVIDELDKQEQKFIENIVNNFKNLFTLSEAQFIFICGQETYEKVCTNSNEVRPKEYTYFTSNYFLSRPQTSDLMEYFDLITDSRVNIKENDLVTLKKALIFEAYSDFFDLKACIRNRITSFDESNKPIIELNVLTDEDIQKARFQQLISILFEEKYISTNPLKWNDNEIILRSIYNHAYQIYTSLPQTEFLDPYDDSIVSDVIKNFNSLLVRCGAFSSLPLERVTDGKYTIHVKKYKYKGFLPVEPPLRLSDFTEYEEKFLKSFERYCKYAISVINAFGVMSDQEQLDERLSSEHLDIIPKRIDRLGIRDFKEYPQCLKVYKIGKKDQSLQTYNREELEELTTSIKNSIEVLFTKIPDALVYLLRKEYNFSSSKSNSKYIKYLDQKSPNKFVCNPITQELNNFSYIELSNDKEVFIGIDNNNLITKDVNPNSNETHENEILILEIDKKDENDYPKCNIKTIETDSPKNLKETLIDFLENINEYMNELHENGN